MNLAVFLILYMLFMIPTYLIRFAVFGAAFDNASRGLETDGIGGAGTFMFLICFAVMGVVAFFRGRRIGKPWLVVFPVVAGVFDIVLVFIPFIPTVMHVLAIVLGAIVSQEGGKSAKADPTT